MVNALVFVAIAVHVGCASTRRTVQPPAAPAVVRLPADPVPTGCVAVITVPSADLPSAAAPSPLPFASVEPKVDGASCQVTQRGPGFGDSRPDEFALSWYFRVPAGYTGPIQCSAGTWTSPTLSMAPGALWPAGTSVGALANEAAHANGLITADFCDWGWTEGLSRPCRLLCRLRRAAAPK